MISFKGLFAIVAAFVFTAFTNASAFGICDPTGYPFGGGRGTSSNPYLICSLLQFVEMATISNYKTGSFLLASDIDLPEQNWTPIADGSEFTGTFDGGGHTIAHVHISTTTDTSSEIGFFSKLGGSAQISNLNLSDVQIDAANHNFVGGLAGYIGGDNAVISNVTVQGSVSGKGHVGLLAGSADATISNSSVIGAVTGTYSGVAGLVGTMYSGSVSGCSADVTVIGGSSNVAGLVGQALSSIDQSFSKGSVTGTGATGGLIGTWQPVSGGTLTDSYSQAAVHHSGGGWAGGLVSNPGTGTVDRTYATGTVTSTYTVGGLLALLGNLTVTNSFWDTESSGQATSAGGTGITTAQAKTQSTFENAGFDFNSIWDIEEGTGYPTLRTAKQPPNSDPELLIADVPRASVKARAATVSLIGNAEAGFKYYALYKTEFSRRAAKAVKFPSGKRKVSISGLALGRYRLALRVVKPDQTTYFSAYRTFRVK